MGVEKMKRLFTIMCWLTILAIVFAAANLFAQDKQATYPERNADIYHQNKLADGLSQREEWKLIGRLDPIPDTVAVTITQSQVYRLNRLDSDLTTISIAWELAKNAIVNKVADQIMEQADRSGSYLYNLLPAREDLKLVLSSVLLIEKIDIDWEKGKLKLTAETKYALSRIAPAIIKLCKPDALSEIRYERGLAADAMSEISKMQQEVAKANEESDLKKRYLDAVKKLNIANELEKGRYYAISNQIQESISAYTRAIENSPELAIAYRNRGALYTSIGDESKALKDIALAAQLGDERAQEYLSSKGIEWHLN